MQKESKPAPSGIGMVGGVGVGVVGEDQRRARFKANGRVVRRGATLMGWRTEPARRRWGHWNRSIHGLIYNALKVLSEMHAMLFDECSSKYKSEVAEGEKTIKDRQGEVEKDRGYGDEEPSGGPGDGSRADYASTSPDGERFVEISDVTIVERHVRQRRSFGADRGSVAYHATRTRL